MRWPRSGGAWRRRPDNRAHGGPAAAREDGRRARRTRLKAWGKVRLCWPSSAGCAWHLCLRMPIRSCRLSSRPMLAANLPPKDEKDIPRRKIDDDDDNVMEDESSSS